jgi:hypothetical protein
MRWRAAPTAWRWWWTWATSDNPHMGELARRSADRLYRQIPAFVQANFVVKKLDEMAEYLSKKTGKLATPMGGVFTVGDLVSLLKPEHDAERQALLQIPPGKPD